MVPYPPPPVLARNVFNYTFENNCSRYFSNSLKPLRVTINLGLGGRSGDDSHKFVYFEVCGLEIDNWNFRVRIVAGDGKESSAWPQQDPTETEIISPTMVTIVYEQIPHNLSYE